MELEAPQQATIKRELTQTFTVLTGYDGASLPISIGEYGLVDFTAGEISSLDFCIYSPQAPARILVVQSQSKNSIRCSITTLASSFSVNRVIYDSKEPKQFVEAFLKGCWRVKKGEDQQMDGDLVLWICLPPEEEETDQSGIPLNQKTKSVTLNFQTKISRGWSMIKHGKTMEAPTNFLDAGKADLHKEKKNATAKANHHEKRKDLKLKLKSKAFGGKAKKKGKKSALRIPRL